LDNSAQSSTDAPALLICSGHGERPSAVVCRHVLGVCGEPKGWVENKSGPNDTQGWCLDCEAKFESEGGMTDAFLAFNDFALVCDKCYLDIVAHHSWSVGADV
jgi:hypothetical protein